MELGLKKRRSPAPGDASTVLHRKKLAVLAEYVSRHGWPARAGLPTSWNGVDLYHYAKNCRSRRDRLPQWVIASLQAIPGWFWSGRTGKRDVKVDTLRRYVDAFGWTFDDQPNVVFEGVDLGAVVRTWRTASRRPNAPVWLKAHLENRGEARRGQHEGLFKFTFGRLELLCRARPGSRDGGQVPDELARLARWLYRVRRHPERVPAEIRRALRRLGIVIGARA